jgi:hypothetical protein
MPDNKPVERRVRIRDPHELAAVLQCAVERRHGQARGAGKQAAENVGIDRVLLWRLLNPGGTPRKHVSGSTYQALLALVGKHSVEELDACFSSAEERELLSRHYRRWLTARLSAIHRPKYARQIAGGILDASQRRTGELRELMATRMVRAEHCRNCRSGSSPEQQRKCPDRAMHTARAEFLRVAKATAVSDARITLAIWRAIEPLVDGFDSSGIELDWWGLQKTARGRKQLARILRLGLERETELLRRDNDASRARRAAERAEFEPQDVPVTRRTESFRRRRPQRITLAIRRRP